MLLSLLAVYLALRRPRRAPPPPVVVADCRDVAPGMRRVGRGFLGDLRIKFDVPEATLAVDPYVSDTFPAVFYVVVRNHGSTKLWISEERLGYELDRGSELSWPLFSDHVEETDVRNVRGAVLGKDHWGIWKNGERWRVVIFDGGEEVGYPPTPFKQAALFDQVISSACFSAAPGQ